MTFIRKYQLKNRSELIKQARRLGELQTKKAKRFQTIIKIILFPAFLFQWITPFILELPIIFMGTVANGLDYISELIKDSYRLLEDKVFLGLYKLMKMGDE